MRYNNIGGIMLSSLDMDDFTGMFCTGNNFPLLNTIHNQLIAPLPKTPRLRTNNQPRNIPIDISRKPTITTSGVKPTFPTTQFVYDTTIYETTTELPAISVKSNRRPDNLDRSLKHVGDSIILDLKTNLEATQEKAKTHQPDRKRKTATAKHFDSLASSNNPQRNIRLQSMVTNTQPSQNPPSDGRLATSSRSPEVPTVNQVHKMTGQTTTSSSPTNSSDKNSELKQFLKNAADLPTHSLINGIMKLLEQSGQTAERGTNGNEVITLLSASKIATPTLAAVTTTTQPPIRTHIQAPDIPSRDMRASASSNKHNPELFKNAIKVKQPIIDINRDIISGQKKTDRLTNIPLNKNDFFASVRQPGSDKVRMSSLQTVDTSETRKTKQLAPPPFPLPDQREVRPSKSFLDMKDLGFLP